MAKQKAGYADYEQSLRQALDDLPAVLVVCGEEEFLRTCAVEELTARIAEKNPGIAEAVFYGPGGQGEGAFDFSQVILELGSSSLFASSKLVVFRRADRVLFQGGTSDSQLSAFTDYLKNPAAGNFLIIELAKINRQRNLGKTLAGCPTVDCPPLTRQNDVVQWLTGRCRGLGKQLDRNAADMLFTAHGGNLGVLAAEVEKLAIYVADAPSIGMDDVRTFMSGAVEFSVYELTNAVERQDLAEAIYYARLLGVQGSRDSAGKRQDGTSAAHQALSMLSARMENILRARAVISSGGSVGQIASELGMGPWQAENLFKAAQNFGIAGLKRSLAFLAAEMHATHDTGGDPLLSLEKCVCACVRQ